MEDEENMFMATTGRGQAFPTGSLWVAEHQTFLLRAPCARSLRRSRGSVRAEASVPWSEVRSRAMEWRRPADPVS